MSNTYKIFFIIAFCICNLFGGNKRQISAKGKHAILLAVSDEIYDYGYYNDYYQFGENAGTPEHWILKINIYIKPNYNLTDNFGEIVYKFMPFEQIYRLFEIEPDGKVLLNGDPDNHFPITQPSHLTVYMNELDVCRMEKTWLSTALFIDTKPSIEMLKAAAKRQKNKTGFSNYEYKISN